MRAASRTCNRMAGVGSQLVGHQEVAQLHGLAVTEARKRTTKTMRSPLSVDQKEGYRNAACQRVENACDVGQPQRNATQRNATQRT